MWYFVIAGFIALVAFSLFFQNSAGGQQMTVEELKSRLDRADSALVLIDVRTGPEMEGPMIKLKQAIPLPMQELSGRMNELEKYKDKEIAVICRSGNRSGVVTRQLRAAGYKAFNVSGGMLAYTKSFPDSLR